MKIPQLCIALLVSYNYKNKMLNKKNTKPEKGYVTIKNKSYGKNLQGIKIYYEDGYPKLLKKDGSIKFGKNILEILKRTYPKFKWIITKNTDSIKLSHGIHKIRTSIKTLNKMNSLTYDRSRDIKNDIIQQTFSKIYPDSFKYSKAEKYKPGKFAELLKEDILSSLSTDDKDALNSFLPKYIAKESVTTVNLLKATTQIKTLRELAEEMKDEFKKSRSESWWQTYIHRNILIIQQGFIQAIEKMNVSLGGTKYPDFAIVTHDGYLDILEIKKPSTPLIKKDPSRGNYYWETEISKARGGP